MSEVNNVSELIGKTLRDVIRNGNDEIIFMVDENEKYRLFHNQDCCESVSIEDVVGELQDLIGSPILMAEEVTNIDDLEPLDSSSSYTWTFYKFATVKGYVTIRWYGSSNGYYSEKVDFERVTRKRCTKR